MSNLYTADRSVSTRAALTMLGLIAVWGSVFGQTLPQQTVPTAPGVSVEEAVNSLVADALAANLELDGATAGVAQQLAALDQARALYLPSLDFAARYTSANGGRTINFPIGDLLNPVYATLNQITGTSRFPTVQNQEINFQRSREQDTQLSLTQPLYDARISASRAAAQSQYESAAAGRAA